MKDYYKILGVDKRADKNQIKKAYRKLSKQYHPDVNPNGADKFKDISEAYETLSNDEKRNQYDNPNQYGNMGGHPFSDFMSQFMGRRQDKQRRTPERVIKVTVTPIESYLGGNKQITYQTKHSCDSCNGGGGKRKQCGNCRGTGKITRNVGSSFFQQIIQTDCKSCNGKGNIITEPCFICHGSGDTIKFENLNINIPTSVSSGTNLRIKGKGDYNINTGQGDLIIQIEVIKKDNFEKINNDLVFYETLRPIDLLSNKDIEVPHPDGTLKIKVPENSETDKPLRLKGKGYQYRGGRGDLYIKVNVKNTKPTTEELKDIFQKLEQRD